MSAQDLVKIANDLRIDVLRMVSAAGAGHVAGPLSSAEIMATLYFGGVVNLKQDKIILSCGHYVPIQYAALVKLGYLDREELKMFMKAGSRLPGHPERGLTPGIEVSAGPLGQGLSVAVGMALGYKLDGLANKVYCLISDGELQEGQVWEALNLAVFRKLNNLTIILDQNRIQIEHYVKEIVSEENWEGRFESWGLNVRTLSGHDTGRLTEILHETRSNGDRPTILVAKTIAGKGVTFMENDPKWHDKVPDANELNLAMIELGEKNNV